MHYITETRHSREVSLFGTADLAYWTEHLRGERLSPCASDSQADLLISAVASRWMGVTFRELTVSVSCREGGGQVGWYLACAFNSSRLFSFIERACFSTPYRQAPIEVDVGPRPSVRLGDGPGPALVAEMGERAEPPWRGEKCMEVVIFLPGTPGKQFFARLAGDTEVYPFSPPDAVRVKPALGHEALRCLLDSSFAGSEWHLRRDATHSRSKTYKRGG
jgi:hypothetical protein